MMVPPSGAVFGDTDCPRIVAGPGFQFLHGQVLYDDGCCCQPRVIMLRSPGRANRYGVVSLMMERQRHRPSTASLIS